MAIGTLTQSFKGDILSFRDQKGKHYSQKHHGSEDSFYRNNLKKVRKTIIQEMRVIILPKVPCMKALLPVAPPQSTMNEKHCAAKIAPALPIDYDID